MYKYCGRTPKIIKGTEGIYPKLINPTASRCSFFDQGAKNGPFLQIVELF